MGGPGNARNDNRENAVVKRRSGAASKEGSVEEETMGRPVNTRKILAGMRAPKKRRKKTDIFDS